MGSYNADGIFTSTCITSKTGHGYINGNFSCGNCTTQGTITCQCNLTAPTINATKIICNLFEPTTVNTEVIIKADNVLVGDTITHTLLSGATSQFFSGVVFNKPVQFFGWYWF